MNTDTPPCPLTECQFNDPNFTGHCSAEVADGPLYPDCKKRIQAMTPPQPAHGEPWPTIYLDESIGCFGDVRRQDTDEQYIHIQPVGPHYRAYRNEQRQAIGRRVATTWNLLSPHPDLSAVEVHSKETMDEVRDLINDGIDRLRGKKCLCVPGFNPCALCESVSELESALAKLNPPQ